MKLDSILTVIPGGAAASHDLTTVATVKQELAIVEATHDDMLARFIAEASGIIEDHCQTIFAAETVSETFRWDEGEVRRNWLRLSRRPIISITSLTEDGETLAASGYEIDAAGGRLRRLSTADANALWLADKVVVVYSAGYALAAMPYAVGRACIEIVKLMWHARTRDPMLRSHDQPGTGRNEWWVGGPPGSGGLPQTVIAQLDLHRSEAAFL
jgi:hypothetical protein